MSQPTHHIVLSVVLVQDGEAWVAQSLERDFAAHGRTPADAMRGLKRTVIGYLQVEGETSEPLSGVPRAPQAYWDIWARAVARHNPEPAQVMAFDSEMTPVWMLAATAEDNHAS